MSPSTFPRLAHCLLACIGLSCQTVDAPLVEDEPTGPCAHVGLSAKSRLPSFDPLGHRDPLGAKAAKQARAAQITESAWIRQDPTARHPIRQGDFLMVNDQIAVYIEAAGVSDGYQPFGGEILALDTVDPDGKPSGQSLYGETIWALGRQVLRAEQVTVKNDGSDGGPAIVRVSGVFTDLPFLAFLGDAFGLDFDLPAAVDYILAPGANSVKMQLHLLNTRNEDLPLYRYQTVVLFQSSRHQVFLPGLGYANPTGEIDWLGFDAQNSSFALRFLSGPFKPLVYRSGALVGLGSGLSAKACQPLDVDYMEFVVGGPHSDGLVQAVRKAQGQSAYREIRGTVQDAAGAKIADAFVHALTQPGGTGGTYLHRTKTDHKGEFVLHIPQQPVELVATRYALPPSPKTPVAAGDSKVVLTMPTAASLRVVIRQGDSPLPARVQVIAVTPQPGVPGSYGVPDEARGRIVQEFAVTGEANLTVPPGSHRVIVSRGFEWDLFDQTVTVSGGKTTEVLAQLSHTVDSTGVMCADFHIHTHHSADSSDDIERTVKSAVADGLEIPVSSEHEYIIDFQPTVQKLGLANWAFGMPSEEFTTFAWGHFGVVPINPRPEQPNRGAVQWYGKNPPEVFHTIANLPEKPVLIVNHPRSDNLGGYLSAVGFDRETLSGDPELYSEEYGALEAFNESDFESNRTKVVKDWFALLNGGKRVWAVGSSDTHHVRNSPVGYPRTCLRFGHDDPKRLTAYAVRDALRAGKAVVSGGLYMTVSGPDGEQPGDTVRTVSGPLTFRVVVQSPSWIAATQLETIVDGETVSTEPLRETITPKGHKYEAFVTVSGPKGRPSHWVVFHASGGPTADLSPVYPGPRPFAVSNPIFF